MWVYQGKVQSLENVMGKRESSGEIQGAILLILVLFLNHADGYKRTFLYILCSQS